MEAVKSLWPIEIGLQYHKCGSLANAALIPLPHIITTSDADWNPTTYDNIITDDAEFYGASTDIVHQGYFYNARNYRHTSSSQHQIHAESE
jgi:hypothetical protein